MKRKIAIALLYAHRIIELIIFAAMFIEVLWVVIVGFTTVNTIALSVLTILNLIILTIKVKEHYYEGD